tara:strand:- start:146 stop:1270 length:1125 start_codon:yes stop_codon:yes gene_type:complete
MKLFKSLLVAPATLGLLAPMSATANEITVNDFNPAEEIISNNNPLLAGGEGLVDNYSPDGGFSETTTASFSVDAVLGAIDGDATSEAAFFEYQYNIGLSTSFTGEDSLDVAIDSGSDVPSTTDNPMAFDTGSALSVDGVTYSFPLGAVSMTVGNDTDISASFTGACSYSAFTDYMGDCGTGNTVGVGGNGVTATGGYAFDSGFSLAAGISSTTAAIDENDVLQSPGILTKEGADILGIEAAYTADSFGVAVAYVSTDNGVEEEASGWGINANYSFDETSLPTISVGYETVDAGGTSNGYFIGLTWPEVGPGSVSVGAATDGNFADGDQELMTYEASYSYPVNDSLTITPGVYISETEAAADDITGILVKSSFSF